MPTIEDAIKALIVENCRLRSEVAGMRAELESLGRIDACSVCFGDIRWMDCPTGGWWIHDHHPDDDHDAIPRGDHG